MQGRATAVGVFTLGICSTELPSRLSESYRESERSNTTTPMLYRKNQLYG